MSEYRTHLLESVAALRDAAEKLASVLDGTATHGNPFAVPPMTAAEAGDMLATTWGGGASSPAPSAPAARLRLQEVLRHGVRTGRYVLTVPGAIVTLNQSEALALPLEVVEAAALAEARKDNASHMRDIAHLQGKLEDLRAKLAAAERERDGWMRDAHTYAENAADWQRKHDTARASLAQAKTVTREQVEKAFRAYRMYSSVGMDDYVKNALRHTLRAIGFTVEGDA